MKLLTWIRQKAGRRARLIHDTGLHGSFIDYIARGKKGGSPVTLARISAATGGEVSIQELLYPNGLPEGAAMCPRNDGSDDLPSAA